MQYFNLSMQQSQKALPKTFYERVYKRMHSWLKQQPTMNPPHRCDLLNSTDTNYGSQQGLLQDDMDDTNGNEEDPLEEGHRTFWDNRVITISIESESGRIGWGDGLWDEHGPASSCQFNCLCPTVSNRPYGFGKDTEFILKFCNI